MGKQKRARQKFHSTLPLSEKRPPENTTVPKYTKLPSIVPIKDNPFEGLNISFNDLKKSLNDDTKSVKSFKSLKSEIGGDKHLSKKYKRELRHQFVLNKIDAVQQARKALKQKQKRQKTPITGDLMPMYEALDSLLETTGTKKKPATKIKKPIEKVKKRQKDSVKEVKTFKKLLSNKEFRKNPLQVMSQHINATILKNK